MKVRGYRIFYIEEGSGIKDLIELIQQTTAVRMALVIKNGRLILNSSVNLKLLQDYAKKCKKEIVFVNPDPAVVEKVLRVGFEIYENLNNLEKNLSIKPIVVDNNVAAGSEENKDPIFEKKDNSSKKINDKKNVNNRVKAKKNHFFSGFISLIFILLILGLAYFYFLYPTATIEVEPIIKDARQEITLTASTNLNSIDWENYILPLHQTQIEITGQEQLETSGVKLVGDTQAKGIVRFINEREESVKIPAGSIVMADNGLKYRTIEEINIPSLQVDYLMDVPVGMKAGQEEVQVEAVIAGSRGNVGIGQIKNLADRMDKIYVINPEPIKGGTDKRIPFVAEKDIDKGQRVLNEKLKAKLLTKMYQELGGNYRIIEDGITYSTPQYNYSHSVGDQTDTLTVSGTLVANGFLLKNNELDRLLTRIFEDNLANNLQLMSSGINITRIQLEEKGNSMYNIKTGLDAPVIPKIDSNLLAERLLGLNITEAENVLNKMADIKDYRIDSKSNNLPRLDFAVKVVVREPSALRVFNLNE